MEWVDALRGSIVGLDTAPLIYFIEENPLYLSPLRPFFDAADQGHFRIVTSILTLTEVLIHPLRQGNSPLANEYRRILLRANNVETLPVSALIAEEAARLRAKHNLHTPDSIQIATAVTAGATSFLTNDIRLTGHWIPNILVLKQLVMEP
ncbi:MAG TPA: PIN domain-containing protein [Bryobacteraceae bacterium]|jgi:predicted nucleic acid-binding protein